MIYAPTFYGDDESAEFFYREMFFEWLSSGWKEMSSE